MPTTVDDLTKEAATTVFLWWPSSAPLTQAVYYVELKAPEEGNKELRARNQTIVRTRAGNVKVIDRGRNMDSRLTLEFRDIPTPDKDKLVSFLELVQWGMAKVKYRDVYGVEQEVRVIADNGIDYEDTGLVTKRSKSVVLWSFSLSLLILEQPAPGLAPPEVPLTTTVIVDPTIRDAALSTGLQIHRQDQSSPHSPEFWVVGDTDFLPQIIDQFKVSDWRAMLWLCTLQYFISSGGANRQLVTALFMISVVQGGDPANVGEVGFNVQSLGTVGPQPAGGHVLTIGLDGTGLDKRIQLKWTMTAHAGLTIVEDPMPTAMLRRYKLGSSAAVLEAMAV